MMRFTAVESDVGGNTRFVDKDVRQQETLFTRNVPPLLVSERIPADAIVFVEFPAGVRVTAPHPAPRRQIGVVLSGRAEVETTDGEVRSFEPGDVCELDDVEGAGHVTRTARPPLRIMFIQLSDGGSDD